MEETCREMYQHSTWFQIGWDIILQGEDRRHTNLWISMHSSMNYNLLVFNHGEDVIGDPKEEQICGIIHLTNNMFGYHICWVSDIDRDRKTEIFH